MVWIDDLERGVSQSTGGWGTLYVVAAEDIFCLRLPPEYDVGGTICTDAVFRQF